MFRKADYSAFILWLYLPLTIYSIGVASFVGRKNLQNNDSFCCCEHLPAPFAQFLYVLVGDMPLDRIMFLEGRTIAKLYAMWQKKICVTENGKTT